MKKVYFLLNHSSDFNAQSYCDKHLSDYEVSMGVYLPDNPNEFELIIPWSYQKIIKKYKYNNIVIFHSTDLPEGKGWAPIFNVFAKELKNYVISAILLDDKVDSGGIVAKAKFKIKNTYTADFIRKVDEEVMIIMIDKILKKFDDGKIVGVDQDKNKETYYKKRYPEDNQLKLNANLRSLIPVLKGCEESHPSFFEYKGDEFVISIKPKVQPSFPEDLEIVFQ
jgi:methionyl-tRNA formyltransferase